jgi:hypothetical protein
MILHDIAYVEGVGGTTMHIDDKERKHSITRNRESHFWYSESFQVA